MMRLVILSNDTDVCVVSVHFTNHFKSLGLIELWFRAGKGDKIRYSQLHVLVNSVGQSMCDVLPAVHALTGCNITSRFGTKFAALKADPTKLLIGFRQGGATMSDVEIMNAEKDLVVVLCRGSHSIETLDDLDSDSDISVS